MTGEAEAGPSRQEIADALDANTARALPLIYLGVGSFYLLLVVIAPFLAEGAKPSAELTARWAGSGAFGVLAGLFLRRHPAPRGWGNHLAGVIGVVAVLNSLFLVAEAGPSFVFAIVAALLAFALFLLSLPWVFGLAGLAFGSWMYMSHAQGGGAEWIPRTINLLAICAIAIIAQSMRLGLHRRLERLRRNELARMERDHGLAREQALHEQRRRIVRMTAHELGTPMTPVLLQAHLLAQGELSPQQRKHLETLQRNLDRLQQTIATVVAAAQADEKAAELYKGHEMEGT